MQKEEVRRKAGCTGQTPSTKPRSEEYMIC
jgi:hypothetical protein